MAKEKQPLITVDEHFVRVGGKSYAIDKITSVEVREEPPIAKGCGTAMIVVGVAGLVGMLAFPPLIIFAVVLIAIGVVVRRGNTGKYQLFLVTSASEQHALTSNDRDFVYRIRAEIEEAIVTGSSRRQA